MGADKFSTAFVTFMRMLGAGQDTSALFYSPVEYLFTVSEKVFDPPPKVKSAVLKITRNDRKELGLSLIHISSKKGLSRFKPYIKQKVKSTTVFKTSDSFKVLDITVTL